MNPEQFSPIAHLNGFLFNHPRLLTILNDVLQVGFGFTVPKSPNSISVPESFRTLILTFGIGIITQAVTTKRHPSDLPVQDEGKISSTVKITREALISSALTLSVNLIISYFH
ncbi:MAG: hypothetical protein KDC67_14305 [Ignavibacteriae bacterium]|nr:hypothetical protein [Ignavibacteriota bacterium]